MPVVSGGVAGGGRVVVLGAGKRGGRVGGRQGYPPAAGPVARRVRGLYHGREGDEKQRSCARKACFVGWLSRWRRTTAPARLACRPGSVPSAPGRGSAR